MSLRHPRKSIFWGAYPALGMLEQNWWYTSLLNVRDPLQPPLRGDHEADVVIIGAGAAGLAAALRCTERGKQVILLDRNICGGSSTGKSAGFLTPDSELELSQIERRFGLQGARDLWDAPVRGIQRMLELVGRHHFPCDLVKEDSLFLGVGSGGSREVREESEARKRLGFPYRSYDAGTLRSILGSSAYSCGVRYPDCYGIDALLYSQGVKRALLDGGATIHESTSVRSIEGHTVRTHMGSVTAKEIIFCADKLRPSLSKYSTNVYHAQTFLSISEPLSDREYRTLFPDEPLQCWDSRLIYTYFRPTGDHRLLVGGGTLWSTYAANDTTGPAIIEQVIRKLKRALPCLDGVRFIEYWPGRIDMTRDLLPTVFRDPEAPWVHYVLGCVGLPWATFCGDLVARMVLGDAQPEEQKYYRYFSNDRGFLVPVWLERVMGKKLVFTLNNWWAKYHQVTRPAQGPRASS